MLNVFVSHGIGRKINTIKRKIEIKLSYLRFCFIFLLFKNKTTINNINAWEFRTFSQSGEDGIIQIIFHLISVKNRFFVEVGAGDGIECNTRFLKEKRGWQGIMIDKNNNSTHIKNEFVTKENINQLFQKYQVPREFDLLSIDIDGNDYWVWKELNYNPRVVVIEYNGYQSLTKNKVIKYNPNFLWANDDYKGASLLALIKLAEEKNYALVGCTENGVNAFFVRKDLLQNHFKKLEPTKLYKPFNDHGKPLHYPKSKEEWISV